MFLVPKTYGLRTETVRSWDGERKKETSETTIEDFRKGNGILSNRLCTKRKHRKTCSRTPRDASRFIHL